MKKKLVIGLLTAAFLSVFLFSAYKIFGIVSEYKKGRDEYDSVFERAAVINLPDGTDADSETVPLIDYAAMKELNGDYAGWIQIPDSSVNYPVVFRDNDYYLQHTFLGSYNSAGCIFLDYRSGGVFDAENTVIYGHKMNDGSMFADILQYSDPAYYDSHREVRIYTEDELLIYEVFAAREVGVEDGCYTVQFGGGAFGEWIDDMASMSGYSVLPELGNAERVITLSTCVPYRENRDDYRFVLQAVLADRRPLES